MTCDVSHVTSFSSYRYPPDADIRLRNRSSYAQSGTVAVSSRSAASCFVLLSCTGTCRLRACFSKFCVCLSCPPPLPPAVSPRSHACLQRGVCLWAGWGGGSGRGMPNDAAAAAACYVHHSLVMMITMITMMMMMMMLLLMTMISHHSCGSVRSSSKRAACHSFPP